MNDCSHIPPLREDWHQRYQHVCGWCRQVCSVEEMRAVMSQISKSAAPWQLHSMMRRLDKTRDCELLVLDLTDKREVFRVLITRSILHGSVWIEIIQQWQRERALGRRA